MTQIKNNNQDQGMQSSIILFAVIAIVALMALVFVVMMLTQADDITQNVAVSNATPTIASHTTASSSGGTDITTFTPAETTTTAIYWHAIVTDNNGCEQVDVAASNYAGRTYRTTVTNGATCTEEASSCRIAATGDITVGAVSNTCTAGGADLDIGVQYTQSMNHYTDATDATADTHSATNWTSYISVTDDDAANVTSSDTYEVASTFNLTIGGNIAYGTVALGATSAEQTTTITNSGNSIIDYSAAGSGSMSCTIGSMAVGVVHYNLTSGQTYATGTALTASAVTLTTANIAKRTGAASTGNLYTMVQLASTGIEGNCSNTLSLVAVDG